MNKKVFPKFTAPDGVKGEPKPGEKPGDAAHRLCDEEYWRSAGLEPPKR